MRISDWSSDVCSSDLFGKDDLAPIDFDDIAHDRQAKAGPGLGGVQPRAASEQFGPPFFGNAGAVILDQNVDELAIAFHRHKNPAAAVFGGILDQVAEHRSEEHTSELQSLMRISYAVFCLKKTTPN